MGNKLKLYEVLGINSTLKSIIDDTGTKIDPVLKFKLLGVLKSIEPDVSNFDVIRNEKINEYGKKDDDGAVRITPDNTEAMKKFKIDIENLLNTDATSNIQMLKASDIFDKGVKSDYLVSLYPIIEQ